MFPITYILTDKMSFGQSLGDTFICIIAYRVLVIFLIIIMKYIFSLTFSSRVYILHLNVKNDRM